MTVDAEGTGGSVRATFCMKRERRRRRIAKKKLSTRRGPSERKAVDSLRIAEEARESVGSNNTGSKRPRTPSSAATVVSSVGSPSSVFVPVTVTSSRSKKRRVRRDDEEEEGHDVVLRDETEGAAANDDAKGSCGRVTCATLWVRGECQGLVAVKRCVRPRDADLMEELVYESTIGHHIREVLQSRDEADCSYLHQNVSRPVFLSHESALVMEYFSGGTLLDAVARDFAARSRIPKHDHRGLTSHVRARIESWMLPLFGAVHELHSCVGVGHCDLKGNNVCLTDDGVVKVIDFGRARRLDVGVNHEEDLTCAKGREALSYYLVREGDDLTYPEEEDVFALGVNLLHVLVGRATVRRRDTYAALEKASEAFARCRHFLRFERDVLDLASDCMSGSCSSSAQAYHRLVNILR